MIGVAEGSGAGRGMETGGVVGASASRAGPWSWAAGVIGVTGAGGVSLSAGTGALSGMLGTPVCAPVWVVPWPVPADEAAGLAAGAEETPLDTLPDTPPDTLPDTPLDAPPGSPDAVPWAAGPDGAADAGACPAPEAAVAEPGVLPDDAVDPP